MHRVWGAGHLHWNIYMRSGGRVLEACETVYCKMCQTTKVSLGEDGTRFIANSVQALVRQC